MIKILKRQLFSSRFFFLAVLVLPLIGFGAYALSARPQFFFLIFIALIFISGLSFFYYRRFTQLTAQYDIKRQDFYEQANVLESDIEKEWQGINAIKKKIVDYGRLKVLAEKLNQSFTIHETTRTLTSEVMQLFGHKEVTIILYLFQSKTGELGISASRKGQMEVNLKAKKGDFYDRWVAKNVQALLVEDTKNDFRFDFKKAHTEDGRVIRSVMSVPLMIGSKAIGILRLDSSSPNYFHAENIRLLATAADLGAVAIENAQLYEKIEELAIRDSLTGLYLRRYFLERMGHEMQRELRQGGELSFLMIDLDYFKRYNDAYGHMAGDIVLRTVSLMLSDMFGDPGNMICRYGGEEFAVFIHDCSKERAVEMAQQFRKKIEKQAIVLRREKTMITVSIGVSVFPGDGHLKNDLIEKADAALYKAKGKGRNCVCCA
ncbi:MAG: sensor domain-containing diguanylate cyclase [Candidatus Omnitrophota bacterium]